MFLGRPTTDRAPLADFRGPLAWGNRETEGTLHGPVQILPAEGWRRSVCIVAVVRCRVGRLDVAWVEPLVKIDRGPDLLLWQARATVCRLDRPVADRLDLLDEVPVIERTAHTSGGEAERRWITFRRTQGLAFGCAEGRVLGR